QLSMVSFCHEDSAVVAQPAGPGMLDDLLRRPIVETVVVHRIENIDPAREMKRPGRGLRPHLQVRRRRSCLTRACRVEMAAATGRQKSHDNQAGNASSYASISTHAGSPR